MLNIDNLSKDLELSAHDSNEITQIKDFIDRTVGDCTDIIVDAIKSVKCTDGPAVMEDELYEKLDYINNIALETFNSAFINNQEALIRHIAELRAVAARKSNLNSVKINESIKRHALNKPYSVAELIDSNTNQSSCSNTENLQKKIVELQKQLISVTKEKCRLEDSISN